MQKGKPEVVAIFIGPSKDSDMIQVKRVRTIANAGLEGDRYCAGKGSYSKDTIGRRQVTFMNARFFLNSGFEFADSRRNIFVRNFELMWHIAKIFTINGVRFRGLKYCDPCARPSKLAGKPGFKETFEDCGGLIAEVLDDGEIYEGAEILPAPKDY